MAVVGSSCGGRPSIATCSPIGTYGTCFRGVFFRQATAKHHVSVKTGRGNTLITLGPGQFIYGRKSLARTLRLTESTVRRYMKRLESMGAITIQADTHFSIVTVCNWSIYQGDGSKSEHPTGHPTDTQRTGKGQATDTYKKGRKGKKGENGEKGEGRVEMTILLLGRKQRGWRRTCRDAEARSSYAGKARNPKAKESERRRGVAGLQAGGRWRDRNRPGCKEAATSTRDSQERPRHAYWYFLKLVAGDLHNHGVDFGKAAADGGRARGTSAAERSTSRPAGRRRFGNEPAHQDCAPCVPEGQDDRQDLPNGIAAKSV